MDVLTYAKQKSKTNIALFSILLPIKPIVY